MQRDKNGKIRRSNYLNNVLEKSHFETFTHASVLAPALTLVLTPKMVEVLEIRNIMHELLREH